MNTSWRWRHVTQAATQVGRGGKGRGKNTSRDQTTIMSAESACFSNAWRNGWLSWRESIICGFRCTFFFTVPALSHFFCSYDSAIQALTRSPGHHAVDCVSRIEYWQRTFAHTHTYKHSADRLFVCVFAHFASKYLTLKRLLAASTQSLHTWAACVGHAVRFHI